MPRHRPPASRAQINIRLEPSNPAAHATHAYRCYLPVLTGLGTIPLHGTRPSTSSINRFRASGGSQGGFSVPLTRISGYRAPRAPHLAQPFSPINQNYVLANGENTLRHNNSPFSFNIQNSTLNISEPVELSGLEPPTCALRTHRSPS